MKKNHWKFRWLFDSNYSYTVISLKGRQGVFFKNKPGVSENYFVNNPLLASSFPFGFQHASHIRMKPYSRSLELCETFETRIEFSTKYLPRANLTCWLYDRYSGPEKSNWNRLGGGDGRLTNDGSFKLLNDNGRFFFCVRKQRWYRNECTKIVAVKERRLPC